MLVLDIKVYFPGRMEYQSRPSVSGAASFKRLLARLPPRVHSVYYRDNIGNISSSHLRVDSRKVYYKFNPVLMLAEPLMLVSVFLLFFGACILYHHGDISIQKFKSS